MTAYAILVVIDASSAGDAWEALSEATQRSRFADDVQFISSPWAVEPTDEIDEIGREFDTLDCFDQHPER